MQVNQFLKKLIFVVALILITSLSFAYEEDYPSNLVRVISLREKTASQLLPSIKPFLSEGGVIEGKGRQLIIKTDPQNLHEIRQLVNQLDRPPIQFLVTVRREGGQDNIALRHQRKRIYSTRNRKTRPLKQQIKILEGKTAFISSGKSFPVRSYGFAYGYDFGPKAGAYSSTPEYIQVESGFYLTPRLSGSKVLVDIKWSMQSLEDDQMIAREFSAIDNEAVSTQMSVRLGEWSRISDQSQGEFHDRYKRIFDTNNLQNPPANLYIKIDLVNPMA